MSDTLDAVIAALKAEFLTDVVFQANLPSTVSVPSVVVVPTAGEEWLQPSTIAGGMVQETWDILAAVSVAEPEPGIAQMRNLALRIRRAVSVPGAVWRNASGGRRLAGAAENSTTVVSVATVTFHYDPVAHLAP